MSARPLRIVVAGHDGQRADLDIGSGLDVGRLHQLERLLLVAESLGGELGHLADPDEEGVDVQRLLGVLRRQGVVRQDQGVGGAARSQGTAPRAASAWAR